MNTKNFLPTLLALIIRVMVSGQTQDNSDVHRTLSLLGGNKHQSSPNSGIAKKQSIKEKSEAVQKDLSANPSKTEKIYPTLISSEEFLTPASSYQSNQQTSSIACTTIHDANALSKEVSELSSRENAIRNEAATKTGNEKLKLIASANALLNQALLKQIQISEISGTISHEQFKASQITYAALLFRVTNETIIGEAAALNSEAVYSIRLAKEMREEAYSLSNTAAQLGTMGNAEEKEYIAIGKQNAAIALLKHALASVNKAAAGGLAVK